jgi:hypothetical protein
VCVCVNSPFLVFGDQIDPTSMCETSFNVQTYPTVVQFRLWLSATMR